MYLRGSGIICGLLELYKLGLVLVGRVIWFECRFNLFNFFNVGYSKYF